jgi:CubicO group peptidase (beta-lactamase class C family)
MNATSQQPFVCLTLPVLSMLLALAAGCGGALPEAAASAEPTDWSTAAPAEAGLDAGRLAALTAAIRGGAYPNMHAVLIARGGVLVYEEYFEGEDERRGQPLGHVAFDAHTLHDVRSVTKAVVGALVGIAIGSGLIESADQPLIDFFPEYADLATPERRRVTLRHALTMSTGLQWDEETYPYTDARNDETGMDRSDDPVHYVLSRPIVAEPGALWNYSGGLTQVLAVVLQRVSGRSFTEYAREALFEPLGISEVEWVGSLGGLPSAASGLRLRPRDLARFGSLYLNGGRWQGRPVVPAAWIEASLRRQIATGTEDVEHYGYQQWFIYESGAAGQSVAVFAAAGNGGQRIFLVPHYQLLVVTNGGNYNRPGMGMLPYELLHDHVLPAVVQQPAGF